MPENNSKGLREVLKEFVISRTSVVYLLTEEERRVELEIRALSQAFKPAFRVYVWSCTTGVTAEDSAVVPNPSIMEALDWFMAINEAAFLVVNDIHVFLRDNPPVIRKFKDTIKKIENTYKTIFLISPFMEIPPEMANEVVLVDVPLPQADEVEKLLFQVISREKNGEGLRQTLADDIRDQMVKLGAGLTSQQLIQAVRKAIAGKSAITAREVDLLLDEKKQIVKKSGLLELIIQAQGFADLGGFATLKRWLELRKDIFSKRAREYGLSMPKGVLLMGISGCGKSLCVKAIADFWKLPLLRLDMGRLYDGLQGTPEECFRKVIKTAEASAPCVLWIDEIEAGIANAGQKSLGGAASRVLANFLTWMQEKTSPVFIGATANQIELLPPEILRKGRFDELFYVELPSDVEREEIIRIHLARKNVTPQGWRFDNLRKITEGFNGAEIEQGVIGAVFRAFTEQRPVNERDLYIALESMVPLSTTMQEQIKQLERWAHNRALKAGGP
ncbi:MAG: AAA family ATPase [Thermodesulfobacteriota bacterium]